MFALQRTLTAGYLTQRWTRTLLIVLSIALGVSTLVATRALSQNLSQAADTAINPFTEGIDLIVDNGQAGVPRELARKLDRLEDIASADPLVLGNVAILEPAHDRLVLLVGIDVNNMGGGSGHSIIAGFEFSGPLVGVRSARELGERLQAIRARGEVPAFLGQDLAARLENTVPPGGLLRLKGAEAVSARWSGIVRLAPEVQQNLGSNTLFMTLEDAARVVMPGRPDFVSRIGVRFRPNADREAATRQVQAVVGNSDMVRTVDASNESVRDVTKGLELGFLLGGAGALVVGLFLVYNALSVSVAERRHDIGMLRSLGATRGQVIRLFLLEGLALGLIGSLLGLPVGYGLAWASLGPVRKVLEELFNVSLKASAIPVKPWTVSLALVAGPVTAVLAALVPALQAADEEPADAVRRSPRLVGAMYRLVHIGVVGLMLGIGLACVLGRTILPARVGAYGGVVSILIGALAATPLVASTLARFLQPVSRRLLGLEGRLAADNLVRAPGRTGLVIAALAATSALLVQTAGFIHSTESTLVGWIDDKIAADLFILSGNSLSSAGLPMDQVVGDRLRADPRVRAVLPVRGHQLTFRNRIVVLLALDVTAMQQASEDLSLARAFRRHPELTTPGTCLMSENFAALYGVAVGDTVTVPGPFGGVDLRVIGTAVDYTWNRGTLIVDRAWFAPTFKDEQIDIFDVWLQPGADRAAVAQDLRKQAWVRDHLLVVVTREEARDVVVSSIRRLYGLLYVQQGVVGLVALLGVVMALFISVLQRRRELGLLRALGASRAQILRSVLAEATLMGTFGALIGLVVGVLLEWYVVRILMLDEAGWVFPVQVPWMTCLIVIGGSVLLATVVGLWPAYYATRLRIPEAIAYE